MSSSGINWQAITVFSESEINWTAIETMSVAGINWLNVGDLSTAGINWLGMETLSQQILNWDNIADLTTSGINWFDIAQMTTSSINWDDITKMTAASVNWNDLAYMTRANVNWFDISTSSTSGVNWVALADMTSADVNWADLKKMTTQNINWSEMSYFSANARTLISNVGEIMTLIGEDPASTSTDNVFGKINTLLTEIGTGDIAKISSLIGTESDTSTTNTLFGDINHIQALFQKSGTDVSLGFVQMGDVEAFAKTGKESANAALGIVKNMEVDLGVQGQSPNAYEQMRLLEEYIKDIQNAALALGDKQDATTEIAQKVVAMMKDMMNEQAKQAGLESTGLMIEELSKKQASDAEKVNEKLEEINAKIMALQEAMKIDDVVVKTWFESEE